MFENKSILITGGTGSFGRQFTEKVLSHHNPKRVIIYSRDEFKQDVMQKEFALKFPEKMSKIRFFIGDVRDKARLYRALNGVDYVIHAAALKQVPACEYNPFEAIKTNIHGAQNVIDAALDQKVEKVVALSTDKAVNPINLYGGTKLVSDKLFVSANSYSGNVSGSRGSVIPFFRSLLEKGETTLPVTDERMTRFWMTLDDAVDLVLLALEESKGGETYVYKNPSYKITDITEAMNPGGDIKVVGIREGEKIHEVMITADDSRTTYDYGDYYIIYPNYVWWTKDDYYKEGGKLIEQDWEYNSGNNTEWLAAETLREKIAKLEL